MIPRQQLGDELMVTVQVLDTSLVPQTPDAAPTLRIYNSSGTKVATILMPPADRDNVVGLFEHTLLLNWTFAVGFYSWRASYAVGGVAGVEEGYFEVADGGGADGSIIALAFMQNPDGTALVQHTDNDTFLLSRNPRA